MWVNGSNSQSASFMLQRSYCGVIGHLWAHYSDKHRGSCLGFEIPAVQTKKVDYISTPGIERTRTLLPPSLGISFFRTGMG